MRKSPSKAENQDQCPAGGQHSLKEDPEGLYCEKCLEPVVVTKVVKRKVNTRSDDAAITKAINQLTKMLDKRAGKLGCVNGMEHTACLDALNLLLTEWSRWRS